MDAGSPDAGPERACRREDLALGVVAGVTGPLGARALLARDVTGDGRVELLLLLKDAAKLVVLGRSGDGGLALLRTLEAGSTPNDLVAEDLDGDGLDELLLVGHFSDALRVFRGTASGWEPPVIYPLGNHSQRLRLVDLDQDGRLDVVTKNGGSAGSFTFSFLRGRGDGTFAPPLASVVPDTPADLEVRLAGQGGRPEVLVGTMNDATIERWSFAPDGGFTPLPAWPLPGAPLTLSLVDLDGDGPGELIATHGLENPGFVSILSPTPDGGITTLARLAADGAHDAIPADVTGDGRLDLVVSTLLGELLLFPGPGDGGFVTPRRLVADGGWPTSTVASDLDGDGHLDLAWTTHTGLLELALDADRCAR